VKDQGHLFKLLSFLESSCPVRFRYKPSGLTCSIRVTSFEMCNDLGKYGVVPRKSKTAECLCDEMLSSPDFWRGEIDGDGHWAITANGSVSGELCGSEFLMNQFVGYIEKTYGVSLSVVKKPNKHLYRVYISSDIAQKLARDLYYDGCIALDRKLKTAERIVTLTSLRKLETDKWGDIPYIMHQGKVLEDISVYIEDICNLYKNGKSTYAIEKQTGIPCHRITYMLQTAGIYEGRRG
jgi:hypothetical protein